MWVDLAGSDDSHNLATLWTFNLVKGTYYELRFRVKNSIGWSEFSPSQSFIAADYPSEPNAPTLTQVSKSEMTLEFDLQTIDNGGLPLTGFKLEGTDDVSLGFTIFASYLGTASHTLTVASDSLVEGKIYTLRWFAQNAKGDGTRSDEILVALVDQPSAPALLWKHESLSSQTAITVEWQPVTAGVSPGGNILGYKLMVKNPNTSITETVFNGFELGLPAQV